MGASIYLGKSLSAGTKGCNIVIASAGGSVPIVTTGLVMDLDAGNSASYSGSGTTWTDLTGNSRNGTLINGVGYSSLNGGYLTFDGTNDYVNVLNTQPIFNNVNKFSVESWFKLTNAATNNTIFSFGDYNGYNYDILVAVYGSTIYAQVNSGADGSATKSFTSTAWTQMVVVYDGTQTGNANRLKIYINGVLQTMTFDYTVPATTSNQSYTNAGIGAYSSGGYNNYLTGNISIIRAYNIALSDTDVTQNFNAIKSRYGL